MDHQITAETVFTCSACEHRTEECVLTGDGVEKHQVLEVGYLAPLPALRHDGRLEELLGCG